MSDTKPADTKPQRKVEAWEWFGLVAAAAQDSGMEFSQAFRFFQAFSERMKAAGVGDAAGILPPSRVQ